MVYKVGDEVLVKARIASVFSKTYTANCSCGPFYFKNEDILQEPQMTAEEAWEIAKKVLLYPSHGGFNATELEEIFGRTEHLWELTPQQAKAKIEAWEAEKDIKVGDVITPKEGHYRAGEYGIVVCINSVGQIGVNYPGNDYVLYEKYYVKKTGQHLDIDGFLKQIGGDE